VEQMPPLDVKGGDPGHRAACWLTAQTLFQKLSEEVLP